MASSNKLEEAPPALMAERPSHHHQNPLKLLELLVKGFCPTIIEDRVEIHGSPGIAEGGRQSSRRSRSRAAVQPLTTSTEPSRYQLCSCRQRAPTEQTPLGLTSQRPNDKEKPFEIGERPPNDVIGISKKIWEGFCSNSHPPSNSSNNSKHHTQPPPAHQHRGFCSILSDQYRALCQDEKEAVPEGEEMSVSSAGSGSFVDLSPQSSPRAFQQSSAENTYTTRDNLSVLDLSIEGTGEEEDDEDDEPVAEFEVHRSHRGIQVLIATLLVMSATFALLQNWDAMNHQKFHFSLQPKPRNMNIEIGPRSLGIRLARKDKRLIDAPLMEAKTLTLPTEVMEDAAKDYIVPTPSTEQKQVVSPKAERIEKMLNSPFGRASGRI